MEAKGTPANAKKEEKTYPNRNKSYPYRINYGNHFNRGLWFGWDVLSRRFEDIPEHIDRKNRRLAANA